MNSSNSSNEGVCWAPRRRPAFRRPLAMLGMVWALIVASVAAPGQPAASVAPASDVMTGNEISFTSSSYSSGSGVGIVGGQIRRSHELGFTGQGIDVALIDTGVAPAAGLDEPGKVLFGPDLSGEGAHESLATLDTYGHGTHLAGIIAGSNNAGDGFSGVAPDARIISLKIAGANGRTSVAQAIAAIEWVVEHRNSDGLNIRVLNLSFGLSDVPSSLDDPLSAAVERAWDAGIVVVAAAGNQGNDTYGVDSPAISPYVIAVGAGNSHSYSGGVAGWSSGGNGDRDPDLVAAGKSIVSLRVPGSTLDVLNPLAREGDRFMRGSGTSQAAAVASGVAALLLSADPSLTPDQVKYQLNDTAREIDGTSSRLDGDGAVRARRAINRIGRASNAPTQDHARALGMDDWTGVSSWTGGGWNGATWSGATWSGATWSGATWSGATWSGATWSGATWSGATWSGATWSGATWSGATWSSAEWTEDGWDRNLAESFASMGSAESLKADAGSLFESAALAVPSYTVTDGEVFAAPSLSD